MAHQTAHIWHEGNVLKVGHHLGPGLAPAPLDPELTAYLAESMEYDHVVYLRGREQYAAGDGQRRRVRTIRKRLWDYDDDGLYLCGAGYLDRIVAVLGNLDYEVRYKRIAAPRPRPDWLALDLERVARSYKFRSGQRECFDVMLDRIRRELGGVVDASVGFGKSDIIAPLAMALHKAKFAVTVRKLDNVRKTVAQLREHLPSVGQVDGKRKEFGHRVTVYSLDSLDHFDGDADVFVCDEVQEALTPHHAPLMAERLDLAVPIALTATPEGRADGADARLEAIFGPTIFYMPYAEAQARGLVVPIRVVVHPVDLVENPIEGVEDDVRRKRLGVWANEGRNRIIADAASRLGPDVQVLVLVATAEHLANLHRLLPDFTPVWAESSNDSMAKFAGDGFEYEPMTDARRGQLYADFRAGKFRKAIATIWDVGASFDALQVLVWAKGGSSAIAATQGPGRVSRIHGDSGKACGQVYEFDDAFDSRLHAHFQTRVRHYKKHGWTIAAAERTAVARG